MESSKRHSTVLHQSSSNYSPVRNKTETVSLIEFERLLGVPREDLYGVARNLDTHYKRAVLKKPNKKPRPIVKPSPLLKKIQSSIHKRILEAIAPLPEMHGCVKERSPITMARQHKNAPTVVRIDLRDCYGKIGDKRVFSLFRRLGFSTKLAALLTRLTTFEHCLPQGAPTSPLLANAILLESYAEIVRQCRQRAVRVTFYVDDIVLSGVGAELLVPTISKILTRNHHPVSRKKVSVMRASSPQEVTGILVNNGELSIPQQERSIIRSLIHQSAIQSLSSVTRNRLIGKLNYVRRVNEQQANALERLAEEKLGDNWKLKSSKQ